MLMRQSRFDEAKRLLDKAATHVQMGPKWLKEYHFLNLAQIELHTGGSLSDTQKQKAVQISKSGDTILGQYGAMCVLRDGSSAESLLNKNVSDGKVDGVSLLEIGKWPISTLLPSDVRSRLFDIPAVSEQ